jgi:4-methylaminobutanoate oxidase (formaldehyde-forming)
LRVTFVGEFGWELYCPTEYGAGLWRTLWEAGQPFDLRACGYRAIDSLRLEKGYRVWAADITPDETPLEAGLEFAVRTDKAYIGSDALPAPTRRLRCIVLDDALSVALGNEPVRVEGEIRGRVTSGGYGYTVARSIAYAYLPASVALGTPVEVDIFGTWVPGEVVAEPLYDPQGERVRGG